MDQPLVGEAEKPAAGETVVHPAASPPPPCSAAILAETQSLILAELRLHSLILGMLAGLEVSEVDELRESLGAP